MLRNSFPRFVWPCVVLALLLSARIQAEEFIVDYDKSLLGFVNHKRGIASGLLVDPLTYPSKYELKIGLNPAIESATFNIRYDVKNIQVAGSKKLGRWGRKVFEAGATPRPLETPSPSRQKKIRKTILSKKFMDAARYPEVRVKSLGIEIIPDGPNKNPHTYNMKIQIAMHGETVKATFPATIILNGDHLTIDAAFRLKLSDFKIKPYSGFFGAVRFSDQFHVYMHFEATRSKDEDAAP